jgi:LysM repeat protein
MDEFDDVVEARPVAGAGTKLALFGLLFGIGGVVTGITGIVLANQAQGRLQALEARLTAQPDKTPELEKALTDLDERLVKLGSEFVRLGRADRQIQENTQAAFDAVIRDVKANRDGLNQLTGKFTELVDQLERGRPAAAAAAAAAGSGSAPAAAAAAAPEGGVHIVQSGDTLSGIAKRYGVALSRLQEANPTVNPRALQIGQRIVIP